MGQECTVIPSKAVKPASGVSENFFFMKRDTEAPS